MCCEAKKNYPASPEWGSVCSWTCHVPTARCCHSAGSSSSPSLWNIPFIITITLKHPLYCHHHPETSSLLSPSLWNILFYHHSHSETSSLLSPSFWNILFTVTVILKHPLYCHRHSETPSLLSPSISLPPFPPNKLCTKDGVGTHY